MCHWSDSRSIHSGEPRGGGEQCLCFSRLLAPGGVVNVLASSVANGYLACVLAAWLGNFCFCTHAGDVRLDCIKAVL